jgi:hypothetical protein
VRQARDFADCRRQLVAEAQRHRCNHHGVLGDTFACGGSGCWLLAAIQMLVRKTATTPNTTAKHYEVLAILVTFARELRNN